MLSPERLEDILEDKECPICGHIGMESFGGYDYRCPECDYEGNLLDDEE